MYYLLLLLFIIIIISGSSSSNSKDTLARSCPLSFAKAFCNIV